MNNTLLLIDGSSYLYRAFHAMPDLRNKEGEPTGALYGFINMIRRIRTDYPTVSHLACVFDAKGKTFREDLYPEYKANRTSMPEDLVKQIPVIHEALRALGWPVIAIEGVEADDVIGSLGTQAAAQGIKTIISTGDKDLAQLVNDHVQLVNTMTAEVLDHQGVVSKFGVSPEKIVDYLALVGDSVDNVPGVEKCGPKTAVKWLSEFGSLDAIIANAASIKGVVGENLRKALPNFPLTRDLLTVRTNLSSLPALDALQLGKEDDASLKAIYERYGFRTWLRELTGDEKAIPKGDIRIQTTNPAPSLGSSDAAYETVLSEEALERWISIIEASSLTSFDTETTSLHEMQAQLVGMSFCVEPGIACYIPLAHRYAGMPEQLPFDTVLARLKPWLQDANKPKVLQHAKYDMHVLANHGITLRGVVHDTMLSGYVLESHRSSSLESLAERWLGRKGISFEEVCGKGAHQICFDQVSVQRATEYSAEDADMTLQVHQQLLPKIMQEEGL
ncbi:MAG: DNA polymerase I, partial [Burkholderiaceae bacterium]|nr:DNA polymerase I [Burkholderiaceae bacterium]